MKTIYFDKIGSTNDYLKKLKNPKEDVFVIAKTQDGGRGTKGRSFICEEGGVYVSLLKLNPCKAQDSFSIMMNSAVAVVKTLHAFDIKAKIKWPNDIIVNGKKICGILFEGTGLENGRFMIIGIGVNISTENFPPELREIAGAVGAHTLDAQTLIAEIYRELAPYLDDPSNRSWLADYRTYSCVIGKRVRWMQNGVWREGTAAEIDADGALQVETDEGEKIRLYSGEITLRAAEI